MSRVFADSQYFIALLSQRDLDHAKARNFAAQSWERIVTTRWVLTEVANSLSDPTARAGAIDLIDRLARNPRVFIRLESDDLYNKGLSLYRSRPDKNCSLTDCISFVVMAEEGLTEALTLDHHFEQAGFTPLLADS